MLDDYTGDILLCQLVSSEQSNFRKATSGARGFWIHSDWDTAVLAALGSEQISQWRRSRKRSMVEVMEMIMILYL